LPDNIQGVQPGGGKCTFIELTWGRLRRWYLKKFRAGHVRKMENLRCGDLPDDLPHEVLDPRDLKFIRNLTEAHWKPEDDPFSWRGHLPFARWGLAELTLMGGPLLALTIVLAWLYWPLAFVSAIPLFIVVYFFRNPPRRIPTEEGVMVGPADGKVVDIVKIEHDEDLGGPAVMIGIFLSVFYVHINRSPCEAKVTELRYFPGEFITAMNPDCTFRNENSWIAMEMEDAPHRRFILRQISGVLARRIVCDVRPGEVFDRGEKIGMIKLGSRTELILPDVPELEVLIEVGQKIKAGKTLMAKFSEK